MPPKHNVSKVSGNIKQTSDWMLDDLSRKTSVREYFDRIAGDYRTRYDSQDLYYRYFFQERLSEAINGERFDGKTVLDVGAGTGPLYDVLKASCPEVQYLGLDISEGMLANSSIPQESRIVGEFPQATEKAAPFDRIYCLGVTTYLDRPSLQRFLQGLVDQLSSGGSAAVTFTNAFSFDSITRWMMFKANKLPIIRYLLKDRITGQSFEVHEVSLRQLMDMLPPQLELTEVAYLNHTLTPINRIFTRPSVALARFLHPWIKTIRLLGFLSTDFLVRLRKKP